MTALVEPPTAPFTTIAFSRACRVKMCVMRRSSRTISTNSAACGVGENVAARIHGRDGRVVREGEAESFDHAGHCGGRSPGHAGPCGPPHAGLRFHANPPPPAA